MSNGDFGEIPRLRIPSFPFRWIRGFALVAGALILLLTSVYTVGPEQLGVVQRLGAFVRTTDPGLNFKLPFGIETVTKVPVQRQLKQEFGFRTLSAGVRTQYQERGFEDESAMLTGDLNSAEVEWVVQYRIVDPYRYLFRVREVTETFRAMSEAVMRAVVGDRTVNEVLTVGRQEIAALVEQQLQALCDQYETGLKVEQVVLQDVNPPDPVKPSFNEVNQAQQEKERMINEAQSAYNRIIPKARGDAQKTVQQAEGYFLDRVNRARGDSARFVAVYEAYRSAPEVTRKRIYLETMSEILPRIPKKVVIDDELKQVVPLFNFGGAPAVGGGQ